MEGKFSEFRESDKSLKYELGQFKDPVSHQCLAGTVKASWSQPIIITNILVTEFSETFRD